MILLKEAAAVTKKVMNLKQQAKKIGFVPTMGALHKGHISLIERSKKECDITVCSIFVNPTQFNNIEDYNKYPVTVANDIYLLENSGCDVLFLPAASEIYPNGIVIEKPYNLGEIEFLLEGEYRPGHFQGVCQVVHRLLDIVHADIVFLGEKDYQQCLVIKKLVRLTNIPANIVTVSTYREPTGLAMSSRNLRLTDEQKQNAAAISKMLFYIKANYSATSNALLRQYAYDYLLLNGFNKVDYIAIADSETLQPAEDAAKALHVICLIAAYIAEVRLIDNLMIA